jgi:AGZA family xanthine/uracil permease-like MFS transporter
MEIPAFLRADADRSDPAGPGREPTVAGEVRAGVTTFLTMAYILVVNPAILGAAIRLEGVDLAPELMAATALAAAAGCLLMGALGRQPFALAPGMGLNAWFAYEVCGSRGVPWPVALGAVFLSGIAFLALSLSGVRAVVAAAIPRPLHVGIAAGIGLFLALLGLQQAGLVVDHPATLVTLGNPAAPEALLALCGLVAAVALQVAGRPAALLLAMAGVTAVAAVLGLPVWGGAPVALPEGGLLAAPVWPSHLVGALDLGGALSLGVLDLLFVFLFVDFFDTTGTVLALASRTRRGEEVVLRRPRGVFASDALATVLGAWLGTSTTTSYIESAAGVDAGGRTGLTAWVVAALFLVSLVAWPALSLIPPAATAPVLIAVGLSMAANLRRLPSEAEGPEARLAQAAGLLAAVTMPLTASIAHGVSAGVLGWVLLHAATGRARRVHPVMAVTALLIVARYAWLGAG